MTNRSVTRMGHGGGGCEQRRMEKQETDCERAGHTKNSIIAECGGTHLSSQT